MTQTVYQLVLEYPPTWTAESLVAAGVICPICRADAHTVDVVASEYSHLGQSDRREAMLMRLRMRMWEYFRDNHYQQCLNLEQRVVCPKCKQHIGTARVHSGDRTMDLTLKTAQDLLAAAVNSLLAKHTCEC